MTDQRESLVKSWGVGEDILFKANRIPRQGTLFCLVLEPEGFQQAVGVSQESSFRRTGYYALSQNPGGVPNVLI
jgi:hypothetical protein